MKCNLKINTRRKHLKLKRIFYFYEYVYVCGRTSRYLQHAEYNIKQPGFIFFLAGKKHFVFRCQWQ